MMHLPLLLRITGILCTLLPAAAAADAVQTQIAPLLSKYCASCHGAEKQKGGIELHTIRT